MPYPDFTEPSTGELTMYGALNLCHQFGSKVKKLADAVLLLHREGLSLAEICNMASMYGASDYDIQDIKTEFADL